jgi:hypothetical protein
VTRWASSASTRDSHGAISSTDSSSRYGGIYSQEHVNRGTGVSSISAALPLGFATVNVNVEAVPVPDSHLGADFPASGSRHSSSMLLPETSILATWNPGGHVDLGKCLHTLVHGWLADSFAWYV